MRLLISYCYSLYGCVIWDITNVHVERVCSAWIDGVRRVWDLTLNTHNVLIPLISNRLSLYDEIRKRMLTFIQSCLLSESDLVSFVTRHAVWFGCMSSPLGRNTFHCCRRFDVFFGQVTLCHSPFCIWFLHLESWQWICALSLFIAWTSFVRSGSFSLSKDFADTDIQIMIDALCTA